jgi:hypothetical protein
MHQGRTNYPKFQIHEKTPSILCWSEKLSGVRQRDQSLFSLLLEIESRLRKEGRNGRIEQRKRSRQRSRRKRLTNCTVQRVVFRDSIQSLRPNFLQLIINIRFRDKI